MVKPELIEQLKSLPEADRLDLIDVLEGTLDTRSVDEETRQLLAARERDVREHPERLIPWDEARERLRASGPWPMRFIGAHRLLADVGGPS